MKLDLNVHIHFPSDAPAWVERLIHHMEHMEDRIMAKVEDKIAELDGVLSIIGSGVAGVQGDVASLTSEIAALKDQLANAGTLTPALEASFDAVINKAKGAADALTALDALNPATPTPEPVPTPTPDTP